MVRWWKRDGMMVKTPHDITLSPPNHRDIAISSSYHRVVTIVPLRFHHCIIVHRGWRQKKKLQLSKRNTLIKMNINATCNYVLKTYLNLLKRRRNNLPFTAIQSSQLLHSFVVYIDNVTFTHKKVKCLRRITFKTKTIK